MSEEASGDAVPVQVPAFATTPGLEVIDPQSDLFGPVTVALSLQDVHRGIRGVSRPRDLRPLIQKSTHDPLMNMLELAMKAKQEGDYALAFTRFSECLPYVWTKVNPGMALPVPDGANAGEVIYRWANPPDTGEAR